MACVKPSAERYAEYRVIIEKIDIMLETIDNDTGYQSSHTPILNHEHFKWLVEQGDKIIPYLFHVITHRGCSWTIILLLHQLTSENPIKEEHRGNFYGIIHDWLGWYLTSPYRDKDNIYHGLVY